MLQTLMYFLCFSTTFCFSLSRRVLVPLKIMEESINCDLWLWCQENSGTKLRYPVADYPRKTISAFSTLLNIVKTLRNLRYQIPHNLGENFTPFFWFNEMQSGTNIVFQNIINKKWNALIKKTFAWFCNGRFENASKAKKER